MTDDQLRERANLYARQAVLNHRVAHGLPVLEDEVITLIARAFVIGFAAGLEDGHRLGRETRVRGSR